VVVWDNEVGPVCPTAPENPACVHVLEARSRAPGGGWEPPAELMRPGVGPGPRVAVADAAHAAVVWRHDIGDPRVLQAAWRPGPSRQWQAPIDLSEAGAIPAQDVGIDQAGNVIAAWTIDRGTGHVVQAELRPVVSGAWGAPVSLSSTSGNAPIGPALAVNAAGDAVVVWARGDGVVQASFRPVSTGVWSAPADLSSPGTTAGPEVALAPSGDAVAVWSWRGAGSTGSVVQASFRPAGGGWGASEAVSTNPAANGRRPQVAIDASGNAVAVWLAGAVPVVRAAARRRASGAWSERVAVSPLGQAAGAPSLGGNAAGNAVAVWTMGPRAHASLRPAAGGWSAPSAISGTNAGAPLVRLDGSSRAVAAWSRGGAVEAADLTASGPVLLGVAVPTAAAAERPVSFSARPAAWAAPLAGQPVWRFGDGASRIGPAVAHTYAAPAQRTVTVTQADATGAISTATRTISVRAVLNTAKPSIAGTPAVGSTLTCRLGSWTGVTPIAYTVRWSRNGQPIPNAPTQLYVVRSEDAGTDVLCRVKATNSLGSNQTASAAVRIR
jgi:hypothetical protein